MLTSLEITGNLRERYIQAAALLRLLDHVRGEPTAYGLDRESHSVQAPGERVLKRKFLDSFALVCSTTKGGDSVSVACLEEHGSEGTIVRVASNAGVSESTLTQLQGILRYLSGILMRVRNTSSIDIENEVLHKIIKLDISKIQQYVKNLQKSRNIIQESARDLEPRLKLALPRATWDSIQHFVDWFAQIYSIFDFRADLDQETLLELIRWAQEARKSHLKFLKAAFFDADKLLPRWISYVFKLGRYGVAARVFIVIACRYPALFDSISVEAIPAPQKVPFSLRDDELPLTSVLRRLPEVRAEEAILRLASIWNTDDVEALFRRECTVELVAHAELQIVSFYDANPRLKPQFRFIGVSKKSCYLCFTYLSGHPDGFVVSSCHQKLYLSIPPPATNAKVYSQLKIMTRQMCVNMERILKHDLIDRLGIKRSPIPADSTAGVSLSGLSESMILDFSRLEDVAEIEDHFETDGETEVPLLNYEMPPRSLPNFSFPNTAASLTPQGSGFSEAGASEPNTSNALRGFPGHNFPDTISSMVFHFRVLGDELRQDIIMIDSVLDPRTHYPSWTKLVELLNPGDRLGLLFQDSDYLIVHSQHSPIRVRNERQFITCLQYLLNLGVLNAEVTICGGGTTPNISAD